MSATADVELHRASVVLPITASPIREGAVAVANGRICAVGDAEMLARRFPAAPARRWPGVLLPGLVNAHTHLQYSAFADLATGPVDFPSWISALTARRRDFDDAAWADSAATGVRLALEAGTTCVADVVTDPAALGPAAEVGLAGISYLELVGVDDERWPAVADRLEAALRAAPPGRRVGVSPHSLYTLGSAVFRSAFQLARERGLRLHTHLAETAAEVEFVGAGTGPFAEWSRRLGLRLELVGASGSGRTPAAELAHLGALAPDLHVAHGIHVDAEGRALLRAHRVSVAVCVRSNRTLGAGRAPILDYLSEGSPLAIGTDSLASVSSLDMFEELRAVRHLVGEQSREETSGLDQRLLEAATIGGATALGLDDVGRLAPGARADLAVIDVDTSGDVYRELVEHGSGRCVATILHGRVVHEVPVAAR
ncbi:MAG TPA: amidohydrolase family protein [Mycobacteriales bacterium]|nr:amidohydrolase family protein [Mycobacteriales bacterium]